MADYQLVDVPGLPDPVRFDAAVTDAEIVRVVKALLGLVAAAKIRRRLYDPKTDTFQDE